MNQYVQAGVNAKSGLPEMKPLGAWWLGHPHRRQYNHITFAPGQEVDGAYNLWKGFAVTAWPGDKHLGFLEHVRHNVCQGNEEHYAYLLGWMARAVQCPGQQGEVAVVLRGGKGVGKSFVAEHFGRLFGRHYLKVSQPGHLVGNFNSHLRDVVVLFADEAFYAGDKKHASVLKDLITSDTLTVEAKGVDVEQSPNFVHLIMASNDEHVVPATGDERRFFVVDVGTEQQQNSDYFKAIAADLADGGYENLLHALLTHDLADFEVRTVPQTEALRDQKTETVSGFERLVFEMLKRGELPFVTRWLNVQFAENRRPFLGTARLQQWAEERLRREVTDKRIGDLMSALGCRSDRKNNERGWSFPPLPEARAQWAKAKFAMAWNDAEEWSALSEMPSATDVPF